MTILQEGDLAAHEKAAILWFYKLPWSQQRDLAKREHVFQTKDVGESQLVQQRSWASRLLTKRRLLTLHEESQWVPFGSKVAIPILSTQCQYASRPLQGMEGYPNLGEGLRWREDISGDYHSIKIHSDDIDTFVRRWKAWKAQEMS